MKRSRVLKNEYYLDGGGIESASEVIGSQLQEWKVERQNRLRIRLALEENLLRCRDHFGENRKFVLTVSERRRRLTLQIELEGEIFNPLSKVEHELDDWSGPLLSTTGLAPQFSYTSNTNILRISLPKEGMNPAIKLLIAAILGLITGLLIEAVLPEQDADTAAAMVQPMFQNLLYRILNLISGPVIFFMVLSTVTSVGRNTTKGADHRKAVGRYFALSFLLAVPVTAIAVLLFHIPVHLDTLGSSTLDDIVRGLFLFIPEDIISPFITAETPQLILAAFIIGAAMNALSNQVPVLTRVVQQINVVCLHITDWISKLIPVFIFIFIVLELNSDQRLTFFHIWIPLLLAVACAAVTMAAALAGTSIRKKVPFRKLVKKVWPPFLMALKTGSLSESYGLAEKSCRSELGIEKEFTQISLSHGLVLYMPGGIMAVIIFTIYAVNYSDCKVSMIWLGFLILLSVVLTVAAPPVPGVSMLVYIAVFDELGIESPMLIPALVFDVVFGILAGAMNQLMLQIEMVHHADKVGLLNRNVLRK